MANVVLSIDGRKEVNDRMRPHRGGQGSYDEIVPKFQKLADSRGQFNYYARGTFTHYNLDFAEDVKHLADLEMCIRDSLTASQARSMAQTISPLLKQGQSP